MNRSQLYPGESIAGNRLKYGFNVLLKLFLKWALRTLLALLIWFVLTASFFVL